LGASSSNVLRLVIGKAMWLAVFGVMAGLAGSSALSRVLSGLLFGIGAADVVTHAVVVALLATVALAAAALPAWRATRIPGAQVLR
jgi:putative ABC transport system permease protein